MIKKSTLCIFIFWGITCVLSGQSNVDSLKVLLEAAEGQEKVDLQNRLARLIPGAEGQKLAEAARNWSRKNQYAIGAYSSNYFLGNKMKAIGKYAKAERFGEDALKAARSLKDEPKLLAVLKLLKMVYSIRKKENRLIEIDLELTKLEYQEDQIQADLEVKRVLGDLVTTEEEKKEILLENNQLEAAIEAEEAGRLAEIAKNATLAKQKAKLELKISNLAKDSIQKSLDVLKKEKELSELNASLRRERNIQFLLGLGLVIVSIFGLILYQFYRLRQSRAEERSRAQRQLVMQEKMASLGQLTAGIAHEIKNPLNFVTNFSEGSVEMLEELEETLDDYAKTPTAEKLVACKELVEEVIQNSVDVRDNGARIDRIVKSMMEHANGNQGAIQKVNINELVKENLNLAYHGYRGNHATFSAILEEDLEENLPRIEVIPQDMSRVLLNIFGNACYALHQKQKKDIPNYISKLKVKTKRNKDHLNITIWDNGPGIPDEVKKKIFMPFFSTKPIGDGNSGLGLSISNDIIVQGHQGKLAVESEPGTFTQFMISLPV